VLNSQYCRKKEGRPRQDDWKFEAILGYKGRLGLKRERRRTVGGRGKGKRGRERGREQIEIIYHKICIPTSDNQQICISNLLQVVFKTTLLRQFSQNKFVHVKCALLLFLVYLKCCATITATQF
jgi:hypothetical protein